MSVNKVALTGATGNLGPAVLEALLSAGFEVTVLSRSADQKLDHRAQVVQVNYNSIDSLKNALLGHDAVVLTLGQTGLRPHMNVVNAAVAANVKRIIPSEFGSDTTNPNAAALPIYADKIAVQERLKKVAASSATTSYTLIITGPFFDWGLKSKFLMDLSSPAPEVYDGGDRRFSATTLAGVGQAVAGVLKNLDSTRNKTVYVRNVEISQKDILRILGKPTSPREVSTKDLQEAGFAELHKPLPDFTLFAVNLLKRVIFGEGFGSYFPSERLWNDILGVPRLSDEEVKEIISGTA